MWFHKHESHLLAIKTWIDLVSDRVIILNSTLIEGKKLCQLYSTFFNFELLKNHALSKIAWKQLLLCVRNHLLHALRLHQPSSWRLLSKQAASRKLSTLCLPRTTTSRHRTRLGFSLLPSSLLPIFVIQLISLLQVRRSLFRIMMSLRSSQFGRMRIVIHIWF